MAAAKSWRIALVFMVASTLASPAQAERPPGYYTEADIREYQRVCNDFRQWTIRNAQSFARGNGRSDAQFTEQWVDHQVFDGQRGPVEVFWRDNTLSADQLMALSWAGKDRRWFWGEGVNADQHVMGCAASVRAEQLRRPMPSADSARNDDNSGNGAGERSQPRAENAYEHAQREEEDRLEAERRRARARAANLQVSITARAGNAAGCVQVQPRWENSIHEPDPNPSYWIATTNYFVTNTCGYPIYARITARLANEDVSAWNTVEGPSGSGPT